MVVEKRAVILLSGGLDSATTAALAKSQGYELYALSFDYGQRHNIELEKAKQVVAMLDIKQHKVATIDLRIFGGSALTANIDVPKNRDPHNNHEIPITYVPARNTIFLSFALAYSEVVKAGSIFIGANNVDYSGYPDCRPEFLQAFEVMANLATAAGVSGTKLQICYPLMAMGKQQIIPKGLELGVDYSKTISCYDPDQDGYACGVCDACQLRLEGFAANNIADPITYSNHKGREGCL